MSCTLRRQANKDIRDSRDSWDSRDVRDSKDNANDKCVNALSMKVSGSCYFMQWLHIFAFRLIKIAVVVASTVVVAAVAGVVSAAVCNNCRVVHSFGK